ncbi:DNA ligase D [Cytobacillus oceanisediminis]|uniref:DNA ligase D n=1 Tax=Cytobacillus oceanisediminis TaxID=665099 RepID=UPI001CCCFDD8|nr:DNA ligase D [Cytobacillus oceanisediminis]MBQ6448736.1 DNA ligase D [Bacillus sp. (in: firmicutes)]MBZ9536326.1 DNA ligase D [Cytobacillus oceanisediminis]
MHSAGFFISSYHKKTGTFGVSVCLNKDIIAVGSFKKGLKKEEKTALISIIQEHYKIEDDDFYYMEPGICVELQFSSFEQQKIINPIFKKFLYNQNWQDCKLENILETDGTTITHPDKPLFPDTSITKLDYILYLKEISPYFLPFLQNRLLTTIRFPHGLFGESFYQKQCPDYAPSYVETSMHEGIQYIVCNNLETLLWLGNQLAFEFHIPFETIYSDYMPSEIVFDLDPPSVEHFHMAIQAAKALQQILDRLQLLSFLKISGNKGIQVYLPLPEKTFTYEEVRLFTEFIANYMIVENPELFTIERLKKNRKNRLYIDYIQHSEGKTIIAPYSIRGNKGGFVACPLEWNELTDDLHPSHFSMNVVLQRLHKGINPFAHYFEVKEKQPFRQVLEVLSNPHNSKGSID